MFSIIKMGEKEDCNMNIIISILEHMASKGGKINSSRALLNNEDTF